MLAWEGATTIEELTARAAGLEDERARKCREAEAVRAARASADEALQTGRRVRGVLEEASLAKDRKSVV